MTSLADEAIDLQGESRRSLRAPGRRTPVRGSWRRPPDQRRQEEEDDEEERRRQGSPASASGARRRGPKPGERRRHHASIRRTRGRRSRENARLAGAALVVRASQGDAVVQTHLGPSRPQVEILPHRADEVVLEARLPAVRRRTRRCSGRRARAPWLPAAASGCAGAAISRGWRRPTAARGGRHPPPAASIRLMVPMKSAKAVLRRRVEYLRHVRLFDPPGVHDRDAVRQRQDLLLGVGDEKRRSPHLRWSAINSPACAPAACVQGAQGSSRSSRRGLFTSPGPGPPLLLAAGKPVGIGLPLSSRIFQQSLCSPGA